LHKQLTGANIRSIARENTNDMDRIERLNQFLAQNPGDAFVQHALALEYVKLGNEQEAKRLFENVLQRDENYIGSYFHLAKLLERLNDRESAIRVYEKGMERAKAVGDRHAHSELQSAYEDFIY
jgi:Tfp pilus assembly protein PilF